MEDKRVDSTAQSIRHIRSHRPSSLYGASPLIEVGRQLFIGTPPIVVLHRSGGTVGGGNDVM